MYTIIRYPLKEKVYFWLTITWNELKVQWKEFPNLPKQFSQNGGTMDDIYFLAGNLNCLYYKILPTAYIENAYPTSSTPTPYPAKTTSQSYNRTYTCHVSNCYWWRGQGIEYEFLEGMSSPKIKCALLSLEVSPECDPLSHQKKKQTYFGYNKQPLVSSAFCHIFGLPREFFLCFLNL